MIKHMIILEDELGNRRKVKPGPVVMGPTEKAVGMEATPEWEMQVRQSRGFFVNYKFKTCLTCKKEGVFEHT